MARKDPIECWVCGKRFRSPWQEAYHRHNFPTFCIRNARFKAWEEKHARKHDDLPTDGA